MSGAPLAGWRSPARCDPPPRRGGRVRRRNAGEHRGRASLVRCDPPQMRRRRRPNGTVVDVRTAPLPHRRPHQRGDRHHPADPGGGRVSRRAEEMAAMLASIRHGVMLWGPDRRLIASNAIVAELMNHPPGLLTPGRPQDDILDNMLRARRVRRGSTRQRRGRCAAHARPLDNLCPDDAHCAPAASSRSAPIRRPAAAGSRPSPTSPRRATRRRNCAAPRRRRRRPTRRSRASWRR